MLQLAEHYQSIGDVTAPAKALVSSTYFAIFGRVTIDSVNDVQRSNAHAQDARHEPTLSLSALGGQRHIADVHGFKRCPLKHNTQVIKPFQVKVIQ